MVLAQQNEPEKKVEKKIVIVKETVDKDGNVTKETIELEGEEAEEYIKKHGHMNVDGDEVEIEIHVDEEGPLHLDHDEDIEIHELEGLSDELREKLRNIEVDMEQINDKIILKLNEEGEEPFIWEGEGEIPEDIMQQLKEKGIDLDFSSEDPGQNKDVFIIKSGPEPNRAFLGVMISTDKEEKGVLVDEVIEGSAAEAAGLKQGDIITAIDGNAVQDHENLVHSLADFEPGDAISISYLREGVASNVQATLKEAPQRTHDVMKWKSKDGNEFQFNDGDDVRIFIEKDGDDHKIVKKKKKMLIVKKDKKELKEKKSIDAGTNTLQLKQFKAFPNPTQGQISVDFRADATPTTISITDIAGKEIYREVLNNFDGIYNKQIDLSEAAKGALLLNIQQGDKRYTEKIIFQ